MSDLCVRLALGRAARLGAPLGAINALRVAATQGPSAGETRTNIFVLDLADQLEGIVYSIFLLFLFYLSTFIVAVRPFYWQVQQRAETYDL